MHAHAANTIRGMRPFNSQHSHYVNAFSLLDAV